MENIKTITLKDYLTMKTKAEKEVENIPDSHCRIKEREYNRKLIAACRSAKDRKNGKGKYIVVMESYNQGNARYPEMIKKVMLYSINDNAKETPKTFNGFRKSNILALVK